MAEIDLGKIAPIGKGDYISSNTYENLDIVRELGISYIATTDIAINENPSNFPLKWKVLVRDGTNTNPITGVAKQDNSPTAYNSTTYPNGLFETYIVVEPITTGSAWGIEVTQADLDENFVYFNAKNGVVSVFLTDKISAYKSYLKTTTDSLPMTEAEYAVYKGEILDNSVTTEKTNFAKSGTFPIGKNILNPTSILSNKILYLGIPYDSTDFDAFMYLEAKPNWKYSFKGVYDVVWYDENKTVISYQIASTNLTSPAGTKYISVDYQKTAVPTLMPMIQEGWVDEVIYEPFQGVDGNKIEDLYFELLKKNNDEITIGDITTKSLKINGILAYYQDKLQSNYFLAGSGNKTFTTANGNVGIGPNALSKITTAITCVAIGPNALQNAEHSIDHTAIGEGALKNIVGGVGCTAIGKLALKNALEGNNTGCGDATLEDLKYGIANFAGGYGAGVGIETANYSTFTGCYAGGWHTGSNSAYRTINYTTVTGAAALQKLSSGYHNNTINGAFSCHVLEVGENNATLGMDSMRVAITAHRNTSLGNASANRLITGNDNLFGGYNCGLSASLNGTVSGVTAIGANIEVTRNNEVVIGKSADTHVTIAGVEFTRAQILALKGLV